MGGKGYGKGYYGKGDGKGAICGADTCDSEEFWERLEEIDAVREAKGYGKGPGITQAVDEMMTQAWEDGWVHGEEAGVGKSMSACSFFFAVVAAAAAAAFAASSGC